MVLSSSIDFWKIICIIKKLLDKTARVCYNKDTKGKGRENIKMKEYEVYFHPTEEHELLYARSIKHLIEKYNLVKGEYSILYVEYID